LKDEKNIRFGDEKMIGPEEGVMQSRAQAMAAILEQVTDQPLIVCNGFPSREACKLRDRDRNFYMIGSMGATAGIGLGLAMARPEKTVVVFDGDGNVLMSLGTLATIGALKPKNLIHVVFDNEVYGTTGNQPTYSRVVGLDKMAKAAGYINVERVWEREDIVYEFTSMLGEDGPNFLLVKVNEQLEDADRIALAPAELTKRFKGSFM
jgi:thiamine pyrophosphate-dependent acetolactate synthase large subunit-like protein